MHPHIHDHIHDHIIVNGDDALAMTIVEELQSAGASIVKLASTDVANTETNLADAGVARAAAVVCAGDDDATNLEIALLARKANPDVCGGAAGQRRAARSGGRR